MRFSCKYGYDRKVRSEGKRIKLHYQYIEWPAFVNFYKSQKDGGINMTSHSNDHNHPRSEELFKRLTVDIDEEDETLIDNLRCRQAD